MSLIWLGAVGGQRRIPKTGLRNTEEHFVLVSWEIPPQKNSSQMPPLLLFLYADIPSPHEHSVPLHYSSNCALRPNVPFEDLPGWKTSTIRCLQTLKGIKISTLSETNDAMQVFHFTKHPISEVLYIQTVTDHFRAHFLMDPVLRRSALLLIVTASPFPISPSSFVVLFQMKNIVSYMFIVMPGGRCIGGLIKPCLIGLVSLSIWMHQYNKEQ